MFTRTTLVMVALVISLVVGCASGPKVPPDAMLLFHGPMADMSLKSPPEPGTLYIVDAANGKVVGAFYVSDPTAAGDNTTDKKPPTINGLKKGHTYSLYFVSAKNK